MFLTPILAKTLLTDERTYYPLMAILPVVPVIAVSSVLRGYFQGKQNMKPSAYAQVLEQVVRITIIAICIQLFLPYGIEYAAAGAMLSAVLGEVASLLFLLTLFQREKHLSIRSGFFTTVKESKGTFYSLMDIALPTTGSRLIGSVSYFCRYAKLSNRWCRCFCCNPAIRYIKRLCIPAPITTCLYYIRSLQRSFLLLVKQWQKTT